MRNKKVITIGVICIAVLIIGVALSLSGKTNVNVNSSPEEVAKSFFQSIYTEDVSLFLKCIRLEDISDSEGKLHTSKEEIKDILEETNILSKSYYGDKWFNDIKIERVFNVDSVRGLNQDFNSIISIKQGNSGPFYIMIINSDGNYYLSPTGNENAIESFNDFLVKSIIVNTDGN